MNGQFDFVMNLDDHFIMFCMRFLLCANKNGLSKLLPNVLHKGDFVLPHKLFISLFSPLVWFKM